MCDNLQGSSVGQVFGGGFDGFGYVIADERAGVEYAVPTITKGYLEYELTGMRLAFNDEKYKIFAMYDGDWSSGNLYRATIEQRLPPRDARFKFLTGDGCDSKCGTERRYIEEDTEIPWNPADTYRVRVEWGDGRAGFVDHVALGRRGVGAQLGLRQRPPGRDLQPGQPPDRDRQPARRRRRARLVPGHAHPQRADRRRR